MLEALPGHAKLSSKIREAIADHRQGQDRLREALESAGLLVKEISQPRGVFQPLDDDCPGALGDTEVWAWASPLSLMEPTQPAAVVCDLEPHDPPQTLWDAPPTLLAMRCVNAPRLEHG